MFEFLHDKIRTVMVFFLSKRKQPDYRAENSGMIFNTARKSRTCGPASASPKLKYGLVERKCTSYLTPRHKDDLKLKIIQDQLRFETPDLGRAQKCIGGYSCLML